MGLPHGDLGRTQFSTQRVGEKTAKGLPHSVREDLIQISGAPRQVEVCVKVTLPAGHKCFF